MDDIEERRRDLKNAVESPGGRILLQHIREQRDLGLIEFIRLPVAQKTSKAAFNHQARYDELNKVLEWVDGEVKCV